MVDIFQIDMRDFARLTLFMKRAPFEFRRTTAGVINTIAFQAKKEIVKEIGRTMEVRSPKFVSSSVIVQPTRIRSISKQEAIVASIKRRGFSGWEEQETGKANEKKKVITQAARTGGSFKKKVAFRSRMRLGAGFESESDVKGKTRANRVARLIKRSKKKKRAFILSKKGSTDAGLYRFKGNKLLRLQTFDKKTTPKRNRWMTQAVANTTKAVDIRKIWAMQIERVLSKSRL